MKTPRFLTLAEVNEIHQNQIRLYGGNHGTRDLGLLQSAIAQPEASFQAAWLHNSLFEMAAAYAFHICKNHPFIDGNKRAALASALVFLELNQIEILDKRGDLFEAMLNIAEGRMDKKTLAKLFKNLSGEHS